MKLDLAFASAVLFLAVALAPAPAEAGYRLCNRTSYVVYAAVGFQAGSDIFAQGWRQLLPGYCGTAIAEPLNAPVYYAYARTSDAHAGEAHAWGGEIRLCGRMADFSLKTPAGANSCASDDTFLFPFAIVDVKGQADWTTTFTESLAVDTLETARIAGLQRLLADNGYRIGSPDGEPGPRTVQAVAQFRRKLKMPDDAGDADLLDALESEATKRSSPEGYSICNETDEALWTAIGLREANKWASRGWWKVAPGSCAKVSTLPLSADRVYLLAERRGGTRVVTGDANFCITDVQFDVYGREGCASRGLSEAGFAETLTAGRTGYTARIDDDGLAQFGVESPK